MSEENEKQSEPTGPSAVCAVLTVSDTRTKETDKSGRAIAKALKAAGHKVETYAVVPDDADAISTQLRNWLRNPLSTIHEPKSDYDVIITNGGTRLARRPTVIEIVREHLDRELEGFGELFRKLAYEKAGHSAMHARAVAGLSGPCVVFAMPGSPDAVQLAMEQLIIPELSHLVGERKR